jgi:hypothetical protein
MVLLRMDSWCTKPRRLDSAPQDFAYRLIRRQGTTRLQSHLMVAHTQEKFCHRRLRHCSTHLDGDLFHRTVDSFSVATGSAVRDHLILQAAAPCAPRLVRRISNAAQGFERRHDSGTARVMCRTSKASKCARVFGPRKIVLANSSSPIVSCCRCMASLPVSL